MAADFIVPKTSPENVAQAILDGLEQGQEDIYPDPLAREYGDAYAANPKALEGLMASLNATLD